MSSRDQIAVAQLHGHAMRCAEHDFPVDESVAGLREITTRADLLAHAAGILAGAAKPGGGGERAWNIAAARLLVMAGADRSLLPEWIAQGRWNVNHGGAWPFHEAWPDDLDEVFAEILAGVEG